GIWGSSASTIFVGGWDGTILHYDGSSWRSMTSGASNTLRGVWGGSSGDVFAVGDYGTILHFEVLSTYGQCLHLLLLNE
ncbi:MAG: hypothetical protein JRF56_03825, partial [Deltaproteobacteria bacterium]|nr:hypothetical protein [Deltaproteobacteria bacterium]